VAEEFAVDFGGGPGRGDVAAVVTPSLLASLAMPAAAGPGGVAAVAGPVAVAAAEVDDVASGRVGVTVALAVPATPVLDVLVVATPEGWRVAAVML
jgi:hypothetical protein